jgi:hypothetical protein
MEFCRCRYGLRFFHPNRVPAKRARSEWMVGKPEAIGAATQQEIVSSGEKSRFQSSWLPSFFASIPVDSS